MEAEAKGRKRPPDKPARARKPLSKADERRRAEEALKESEERYRTIFLTAPASIVLLDKDGIIVDINPFHVSRIGKSKTTEEDYIGYSIGTHPSIVAAGLSEMYMKVVEGEAFDKRDVYFPMTTGGVEGYFNVRGAPLVKNGEVIGAVLTHEDITERKLAEEALRESETNLKEAQRISHLGTWTLDIATQKITVSEEMLDIFKYDADRYNRGLLDVDDWGKYIHPDDRERVMEALQAAIAGERPYNIEFRIIRSDGDTRTRHAHGDLIRDDTGKPLKLIGTGMDITERKLTEDALKESEAKYASVVENAMDGVTITQDNVIKLANTAASDMVGYSVDEITGMSFEKVLPSNLRDKMRANYRGRLAGEKIPNRYEMQLLHKSGAVIDAEISVGIIQYQGRPAILSIVRDINERKKVEQEKAQLLARTRELSVTDELTGLHNRRHFYEMLEMEMARTRRSDNPFSLVMLDLDGFKEYNDRFGHVNGDNVLKSIAQSLKAALRKSDAAFRYGGDEFTIILPSTNVGKARKVLERVRAKRLQMPDAHPPLESPLGFSAGIAQFPEHADTVDGLVFLADTALYYAKREGGYRTVLASELETLSPEILSMATQDQVAALAATVDARDPFTYGHSRRVSNIAESLGQAIGLEKKDLADLYIAALLHDIGKVAAPDSILTKPDKLNKSEWAIIKQHSDEGARIVGYIKGLGALVPIIRHHHEWYDGTGYPDGLKGEEIPLGSRVISVADAYDTMTTLRPYREILFREEALEELKHCAGTQFDPELVKVFIESDYEG